MSTLSSLHFIHGGSELKIVGRVFRLNFNHQHLTHQYLTKMVKDTGNSASRRDFQALFP